LKNTILLFLLFQFFNQIFTQDSIKLKSEFNVELKSQHNLTLFKNRFQCIECEISEVPDNPFFHFAIYSGMTNKIILNSKYILETGIFIEQRSYSGGNTTVQNNVIFPKIKFSASDSFLINKRRFYYKIVGGDFWNENINDFLRIYNIDYQASQFEIVSANCTAPL
jgi:hypothetical protein